MQKINLEGLNEYVAYEKLDNNLDVYVYRKKDFHSFYAYYICNGQDWFLETCLLYPYEIEQVKQCAL